MANKGEGETASRTPAHLLTLPQEIQDMIFGLAFQRAKKTRLITRGEWEKCERSKRTMSSAYSVREFPELQINRSLVSKSFFVGACKAYIRSRALWDTIYSDRILGPNVPGVFKDFTTAVRTDNAWSIICSDLTSLKSLYIEVPLHFFDGPTPKLACEVLLLEEDIAKLSVYQRLLEVRGLSRFELVCSRYVQQRKSHEREVFLANVKRLEALLKPVVTRPREIVQISKIACHPPQRLYTGSAVCFGTSKLHMLDPGLQLATSSWTTPLQSQRHAEGSGHGSLITSGTTSSRKRFRESDIPEDLSNFLTFLAEHGEDTMQWIRETKKMRMAEK